MDNYKEIKNLIHNELKITKEDIKKIVIDTVNDEIKKVLNDEEFINKLISNQIKEVLSSPYKKPSWDRIFKLDTTIYNAVCNEVSQLVKNTVSIQFKNKE